MLTVCSQQRCLDSCRVDVSAASRAVHVAVTSVPSAIAITSRLVDDLRHYPPISALNSSKDEVSTCGVDRRVLRYVHIDTSAADPFPLIGGLGCGGFARIW